MILLLLYIHSSFVPFFAKLFVEALSGVLSVVAVLLRSCHWTQHGLTSRVLTYRKTLANWLRLRGLTARPGRSWLWHSEPEFWHRDPEPGREREGRGCQTLAATCWTSPSHCNEFFMVVSCHKVKEIKNNEEDQDRRDTSLVYVSSFLNSCTDSIDCHHQHWRR